MEIKAVEHEKNKLKVELKGESHTLTRLIAEKLWEKKAKGAAVKEHPFMAEPAVVVEGRGPKKKLERACDAIIDECKEFKEKFSAALK